MCLCVCSSMGREATGGALPTRIKGEKERRGRKAQRRGVSAGAREF